MFGIQPSKQRAKLCLEALLGIELADDRPDLTNDSCFEILLDRKPTRKSVFQGVSLYHIEYGMETCPEHSRLVGEVIQNAGGAIKTLNLTSSCDEDIQSIFSKHDANYIMEPSDADLKRILEIKIANLISNRSTVCIVSKEDIYLAVMSGSSTKIWSIKDDTHLYSTTLEQPKPAKLRKLKSDPSNLRLKSVEGFGRNDKKSDDEASTANKFQLAKSLNVEPALVDFQKGQLSEINIKHGESRTTLNVFASVLTQSILVHCNRLVHVAIFLV